MTKLREARLDDLADPGKKALRLLHDALGDRAPVEIRESTALRGLLDTPERSRTAVLVDFGDGAIGRTKGADLTRALIGQGIAPSCAPRSEREGGTAADIAAQDIVAGWVLGDLRPIRGTQQSPARQTAPAGPLWKKLRALPPAEQRARIGAMRKAALSCGDSGALDQLPGGASR
ncbi:hypothetical protein AB0I49_13490 [Streptomyces sp. NPDC050617]|uniref:hypothetical protein n=1 Tax=Streptomyces sp. NPDC050617 TaxID=3154628 RepID=UPI00342FD8BC